jgi:iron complex outermembrane receptor protein
MRSTVWRKTALGVAGAFTLNAIAVQAQTPGSVNRDAAAASEAVETITVTGSRIITNGNEAPTPVTVVDPEQLRITRPTSVFDNLSTLPMFSGSFGNNNAPDNAPNANTAVSALNLRNLGPLRALILFDGHRVPPTTADGLIDINTLPQMLLQRVDVVTGGASAVYGSDAITGVINFVPDRKFNGFKVDLQRGVSTYGDDPTYRIGLAGGTDLFAGRGHFEASFERYDNSGILFRESRPWTDNLYTLQGDGSAGDPFHLQPDTHIGNITFGGIIVCPFGPSNPKACPGFPLVGQTFSNNGVLTPFQRGSSQGVSYGFLNVGGEGAYHIGASLANKARQDQGFARFDFDVTERIHASVTGSAAVDHSIGNAGGLRSFPPGWQVGSCNSFLASQYQSALGCTSPGDPGQPTFTLSRMYNADLEPGIQQQNEIWVHEYFVTGSLEGKFGNDKHWDATYTHSQSRTNIRGDENQNLGHLYAALDAVVNPSNGQIVCNAALTNPAAYGNCVPFNPFGPTAPSPQSLQYIFGRIETLTTNTVDDLSGAVSGALFNDWAGPVKAALSGEVRRNGFEMTSSALPTAFVDCTPLRFGNCTPNSTTQFINTYAPRSPVHQTVEDGAVELNVPLLKDLPVVEDLAFNGAARFTHYDNSSGGDPSLASTAFNAVTWKAGITWAATDWLTVRWARSKDIRAPNLYDLYNPSQYLPNQQVADYLVLDPVTGQPSAANPVQHFSGNAALKPEVGHTTTLGFVFHPTHDLSMAIDGYDISIRDALAVLDGSTQYVQQACTASHGTSPLCALQTRPLGCCNTSAANLITGYLVEPYNIASQRTWGIDFETNYATRVFDRAFSLRTLVTYQPHLLYNQPPLNTNDQAGASYNSTFTLLPAPVWKASVYVHINIIQPLGLDLAERYRSKLHWNADPTQYSIGYVPSVAYTDGTLTYSVSHEAMEFNVFVNVQNIFNKQPPPAPSPAASIFPGDPSFYAAGDDVVGRYYTVGVRARF